MLKKFRSFAVLVALIICFPFFSAAKFALASQDAEPEDVPNLEECSSGDNWDLTDSVLTIDGVNWLGTLTYSGDLTICLSGENVIDGDEDAAIEINGNGSLIISGSGSLVIYGGISCNSVVPSEGFVVYVGSDECTATKADVLANNDWANNYIKIEKQVTGEGSQSGTSTQEPNTEQSGVDDQIGKQNTNTKVDEDDGGEGDKTEQNTQTGEAVHEHSFAYSASGTILSVTCSDASCGATANAVLSVAEVNFGETLAPVLDFSAVNELTGLNLSLDSAEKTYFSGSSAEGAGLSEILTNAGTYTLKVTFQINETDYSLTKSFEIKKIDDNSVSGEDKTIAFQTSYSVAEMFTLGENSGTASYSLVEDGTTGAGSLDGSTLTVTKCGVFKIKLTTSGDANHNGTSITKSLTIQKNPVNISSSEVSSISYTDLDDENAYDISKLFVITPAGSGEAKFFVSDDGETGWTELESSHYTFEGACEKYFKAVIEESDCYEAANHIQKLQLTKSTLTGLTLNHADWIYGNTVPDWSITYAGNTWTKTINPFGEDYFSLYYYYDKDCTLQFHVGTTPKNAGVYYAKVVINETPFTKTSSVKCEVKVNPRPVQVNWLLNGELVTISGDGDIELIYDGTNQSNKIAAYFCDLSGNKKVLNVVCDELIHAGRYSITANLSALESNYVLIEAPESGNEGFIYKNEYCKINATEITLEVNDIHVVFGETCNITPSVTLKSGQIYNDDVPYQLSLGAYNSSTPIGKHPINAMRTLADYEIIFVPGYYCVDNKITILNYDGWQYGASHDAPTLSAIEKTDDIQIEYYQNTTKLDAEPTLPGTYTLRAFISLEGDDAIYNCETEKTFQISKVTVAAPSKSGIVYHYTGKPQTYEITSTDTYTVSNETQTQTGLWKVQIVLNNDTLYVWEDCEEYDERVDDKTIIYYFIIEKIAIEIPAPDTAYYKYNGASITYNIQPSASYRISNATQIEAGKYDVVISLIDKTNYKWNDGTIEDKHFSFVINKSSFSSPITVSASGEAYQSNPVTMTETGEFGVSPDCELKVKVTDEDDVSLKTTKKKFGKQLKKYDKIFMVYDVALMDDGGEVQPNGLVTLKMAVPEKLSGGKFRLYHIHTNSDGTETIFEVDYGGVSADGHIVIQTDKLSSFVFVYEQNSLKVLIICFAIVDFVLAATLVALLVILFKTQKLKFGKMKTNSAVPVFFVASEVVASVVLGSLFAILLASNAIVLALIKRKKDELRNAKQTEK